MEVLLESELNKMIGLFFFNVRQWKPLQNNLSLQLEIAGLGHCHL